MVLSQVLRLSGICSPMLITHRLRTASVDNFIIFFKQQIYFYLPNTNHEFINDFFPLCLLCVLILMNFGNNSPSKGYHVTVILTYIKLQTDNKTYSIF